jgi:hypothetical protein
LRNWPNSCAANISHLISNENHQPFTGLVVKFEQSDGSGKLEGYSHPEFDLPRCAQSVHSGSSADAESLQAGTICSV